MNGYNFTDRVRKVLQMAREEAARLNHEYVGTEHLLLGLVREGEGVAAAVLTNLDVELEEIIRTVDATVKKGKAPQMRGLDLPYTSRAKKVLEFAMSEARELSHPYVGSEHLLLGLLREEKGIAAQVLVAAEVTLESARAETLRLIGSEVVPLVPGDARFAGSYDETAFVFSPPVSKILRLARSAAITLRHLVIDSEHLLIALVGEDGEAVSLLRSLGTPVEQIAERMTARRQAGTAERRFEIPYSTDALRAIWQAAGEALTLRHASVESTHLLLGLLKTSSVAAEVLTELGVTYDRVREKMVAGEPPPNNS
jgi:ATP-dependent Clp protease ATP-binding subunit ClpA